VPIAEDLVRFAVRLAAATRPRQAGTPAFVNDWVSWGAGTRAAQFLTLGAKARAAFHPSIAMA
jgi:MoxR-like ATPase